MPDKSESDPYGQHCLERAEDDLRALHMDLARHRAALIHIRAEALVAEGPISPRWIVARVDEGLGEDPE